MPTPFCLSPLTCPYVPAVDTRLPLLPVPVFASPFLPALPLPVPTWLPLECPYVAPFCLSLHGSILPFLRGSFLPVRYVAPFCLSLRACSILSVPTRLSLLPVPVFAIPLLPAPPCLPYPCLSRPYMPTLGCPYMSLHAYSLLPVTTCLPPRAYPYMPTHSFLPPLACPYMPALSCLSLRACSLLPVPT